MTLVTSPHAQIHMQIFRIHLCVVYGKVPRSSREPGIIVESFSYQTSITNFKQKTYFSLCSCVWCPWRPKGLLGLGLQLVASCPAWVLGTELGSPERETGHLDFWATSPAPFHPIFITDQFFCMLVPPTTTTILFFSGLPVKPYF